MKRRPVILGIDPGKMCGLAYYDAGRFTSLQLPREDALPWVKGILLANDDLKCAINVLCERYIIGRNTARMTQQTDALEVIGTVRYLCSEIACASFNLQTSADAKTVTSDAQLRDIDWHQPARPHANDAARHVLLGMLRLYPEELELVRAGASEPDFAMFTSQD
jgi:hypothetical protein